MLKSSQTDPAGAPATAPPAGARAGGGWAAARRARLEPAALVAAARRHWVAAVLLAAGLALRVLAALAYRPALFFTDTVRYLYNADGMDPVGYKGPLVAILSVGNLDAVAAVQHLLGLAIGVAIYALLLRRGLPRWLAALAMAPVLLDAYQLQTEQSIMPGTWFEALTVAGLAILLWRPGPTWRRAAAAGLVLGATATIAQIGEALLFPAVLCLLVAGGGWRRATARAASLTAAFALPILAYSAGSYAFGPGFFLSHSGVTSFYGRIGAAADCATLQLPRAERGMCPTPAQQAMGPDWLEYGSGSPIRPYYADLPRGEVDAMITDFNTRVLTQQPGRLVAAYGRDAVKAFAVARVTSQGDTPISRWQFQTSYPYYQHATPQVVRSAAARYGGGPPQVWRPVAAFLRAYQLGGGYTPGPLLLFSALAGVAGSALLLRRRGDPRVRELALATLLLFGSGGFVLLISDLFEFSWRYQLPALITVIPGGALGIAALGRLLAARRPTA